METRARARGTNRQTVERSRHKIKTTKKLQKIGREKRSTRRASRIANVKALAARNTRARASSISATLNGGGGDSGSDDVDDDDTNAHSRARERNSRGILPARMRALT